MSFPEHSTISRKKQGGANGAPHTTHTHTLQMKCKNRPGRWGGIARTIQPAFNLHGPFPASCRNAWNLTEGRIPRAEISLGAFRAFFYCLFAFCRRSLRRRVELPTGPPPSARWRAHAPRQPWRRASNPQSANLRISLRRARQTTWRAPLAPAACSLQPSAKSLAHRPCSREGAHVAPRSGAPPLHPWGFHGRSLHPPSLSSIGGSKTQPASGSLGPNCQEEKR